MDKASNRFQDRQLKLIDFQDRVLIVCPRCTQMAQATADYESKIAKLICGHCGFNQQKSTMLDQKANLITSAEYYFEADLWLSSSYKEHQFSAYNEAHLLYLEEFIRADIRENRDRKFFTMVEKLPKWMISSKNRLSILKLIQALKKKIPPTT
ncbi:hypothetical protein [Belliella aquatica]|nr:hypothetical protein [Belliella aquatica]MCH7406800.1 hypothetical protein [Belliella aquatica]